MSEVTETPAKPPATHQLTDYQASVSGQRRRALNSVTEVSSDFEKGESGFVQTTSHFGNSMLKQVFDFDKDGKLTNLQVQKLLYDPSLSSTFKAMETTLKRRPDGKFEIVKDFTDGSGLKSWETEFKANLPKKAA